MVIISLWDQIVTSEEKLIYKHVKNLTFKESISLLFHAIIKLLPSENPEDVIWVDIYKEFEKDLSIQNKIEWPKMTIKRNDFAKRIDVAWTDDPYLQSSNILMLLLRLTYIENYKRTYVFKSYGYHKIMGHKLKFENKSYYNTLVNQLSLANIFDIVKEYILYYTTIYNDNMRFEYNLANVILNQF